jgi:hypothetical protein
MRLDFVADYAEIVTASGEADILHQAYLEAGIVTAKSTDDALHVAIATVTECDMIVSWNFKHIVHYDKKPKYNAVNVLSEFKTIDIITPAEVIDYEKEV